MLMTDVFDGATPVYLPHNTEVIGRRSALIDTHAYARLHAEKDRKL